MSASHQSQPPADTGRRSKQIALVLLGTMGVVGAGVAWDAWQRAGADSRTNTAQPELPPNPVAADRDYRNNEFTPGVGYYHAPFRSWFPFPFNHHDSSRGYFGGGLWQAVPFAAGMLSSRPTADAVTSALAAQQRRTPESNARAGTSGFARTSGSMFGGSSFASPTGAPASTRPTATPAARPTATPSSRPAAPSARPASSPASSPSKPSIQRGGFGSSGKSSGGSSS